MIYTHEYLYEECFIFQILNCLNALNAFKCFQNLLFLIGKDHVQCCVKLDVS